MSFSPGNRTLRSGDMCRQNTHPKTSVIARNIANASKQADVKKINANKDPISTEFLEKRIRTNLEPLNVQISTVTQLLNQIIQDILAKTTPTAGTRTHHPQTRPSPDSATGGMMTISNERHRKENLFVILQATYEQNTK